MTSTENTETEIQRAWRIYEAAQARYLAARTALYPYTRAQMVAIVLDRDDAYMALFLLGYDAL